MKRLGVLLLGAMLTTAMPLWADPAPEFDLPTADGRVSRTALKGQVVYLDFWASWCTPCRKSFPWMNEMQARYGKQGFRVVAINLDKDADLAKNFLAQQNAAFTVAYDPKGETAQRFKVVGMPSSYLIDRSGNVVARHVGFREGESDKMERAIAELVGTGNGAHAQ